MCKRPNCPHNSRAKRFYSIIKAAENKQKTDPRKYDKKLKVYNKT